MSSIVKRPNGHRWITYKFNGKRHTLRLGQIDDDTIQEFQRRLDRLIKYAQLGLDPEPELLAWRSRLDERIYKCLLTSGLAPARGPDTLDELLAAHYAKLIARGRKPSTLTNTRVLHANIRKFFGSRRRPDAISLQEADSFRSFLAAKGGKDGGPLAKATVSNRCRRARSIFTYAVSNRWIDANPFREIATGKEWNPARDRYISLPLFTKILDKTADHELRLLLALTRICGLRCPSEVQPLTWGSIDLEGGVLVVLAPKNEEHESGRREVPLFKSIMPYIFALCETCEDNTDLALLFPRHQKSGSAITGRLTALCRRAGEPLWPKAFNNLRASGERDAYKAGHTIDDVAGWWGHSPEIALRHYRRIVKELKAKGASGALRVSSDPTDPKHKQPHQGDVSEPLRTDDP